MRRLVRIACTASCVVLGVTATATNREASVTAIVGGLLVDDLPDVTRS
jgi:hypothetical protein